MLMAYAKVCPGILWWFSALTAPVIHGDLVKLGGAVQRYGFCTFFLSFLIKMVGSFIRGVCLHCTLLQSLMWWEEALLSSLECFFILCLYPFQIESLLLFSS